MSPGWKQKLDRLALGLAAMFGVGLLFFGILMMNESVYARPTVRFSLLGSTVRDEPDRYSYLPGLFMTISGAGLIGFAIGRVTARRDHEKIHFPDRI